MNSLSSLKQLPDLIELEPLNDLLDRIFGDYVEHIEITDFFESEEAGVSSYTLVLGIEQSLSFTVPGLDILQLGIIRDSEDEWPLVLCEIIVAGGPVGLTIRHFPLRVGIENPYLLPVPPEDATGAFEGFSFEVEGTLGVNVALDLRAQLESFSIPPFTIVDTGLLLGLDSCRLITSSADVDDDIIGLGFDDGFRGIHAESAQFYWDIPIQITGAEFPGLRAQLENLAIANQGVSVSATLEWLVSDDGQQFDTAQTELLGSLFDTGWEFALQQLDVVIEANVPLGTGITGLLRIPFLNSIIKVQLGYRYLAENVYRFNAKLTQKQQLPVVISLGAPNYVLEIHNFLFEGEFNSNGEFTLNGQTGINLDFPGLQVQAESVEVKFEHQLEQDNLLIKLENIDVNGFGQIEQSQLVLVFIKNEHDEHELAIFELLVDMQWQDISSRIQLTQQASMLPLPPDDAEISLRINWQEDNIQFAIQAQLDDVDQLWRFIPADMRPAVDDATIDIALTSNNGDFDGEISLGFLLQLPDLATLAPLQAAGLGEVVQLNTGNEDDWIQLQFKAELNNSGNGANKLNAALENPVALTLQLPGLILPEPPVHIAIDNIGLDLAVNGNDVSGVFELSGEFELHPVLANDLSGFVPPQIAQQLNQLLAIANQVDLSGNASLTLGISEDNSYFKVECEFAQAGLELDLFDMLSSALRGGAPVAEGGAEIDLDIDVSIELQKISVSLGSEQSQNDTVAVPFSFEISSILGFIGQTVDLEFALTQESLSFGLDNLTIPIAIPQLPLTRQDLDRLQASNGEWDYQQQWLAIIEPELAAEINALDSELADARDLLQELLDTDADEHAIFLQQFRIIPEMQARLFQLAGRKFLYEAVLAVHQILAEFGVAGSQVTYQQGMEIYQSAVDSVFESLHFDTQMQFEISDARFVLPFNDPSAISVEGNAGIIGIAPDEPLAPLMDLKFKLGISADAIYFAVEGGAEPIPLPDFGRYPGSAINLDRFIIGYGYSKNSLKIDLAGELILSPALIDDVDSSAELGFGIRLPKNNKLQFKLDLIPVVLGEVDFVIPLVAFDLDLRSDIPPPPPVMDGQCRPAWDGLQLVVPDVVRADLKRVKFSPFFGPLPAPNLLYSFDYQIGNHNYGLTQICTDYFIITPLLASVPIPFLADSTPFFNRYCTKLQLAGFGLSFDLTRPFPSPSPLLIFELLGFISDPSLPIDPNGHIANLMYAEIYNARISLPPPVQAMFPALSGVVNKDFSAKVSVATVIALAQQGQALGEELFTRLENNAQQGFDWIENVITNVPDFSLTDILRLLPDELRKVELEGRFVHFDASATFILAFAREIAADYGDDTSPQPPQPVEPIYQPVYENDFSSPDLSNWQAYDYGLKRGQGNWQVKGGQLMQNNNVGDNSPARYGSVLIYTEAEYTNLRLLAEVSSTDNDGLGLVFHFQGNDTYYRFRMTEEQQQWSLTKLVNGQVTHLYKTQAAFSENTAYQIRIESSSQQAKNLGLNALQTGFGNKQSRQGIDIEGMLKKARASNSVTTIKIWINNQLWCVVKDQKNALTKGQIGLDSWWNNGAHFDDIRVYERVVSAAAIGQGLSTEQLNALTVDLTTYTSELPQLFADFDAQDIAAAMANVSEFAVAMVARVRVFDTAVVKMLGAIDAAGQFVLMSSANIDSFRLKVAGIELPLEVNMQGRMQLTGRSAGADSYAQIQASIYADWILIPGSSPNNALARLLIASAAEPASLTLSANPDFTLQGSAELQLFAQQIRVTGDVDISQAHVMMAGQLEFTPDIFVAQNTRLMELTLNCNGRIGPGDFIDLTGEGDLILLGKAFTNVSARIGNQQIEVSASLTGASQSWQLGVLGLSKVQMQLSGGVDFRTAMPAVTLSGEGRFTVFAAQIEGQCRIEADNQHWLLANSGQLFWQGRNWLDGSVILSDTGVQLQGRADFAINLTPQQLPANINIAGLHLNATVSGKFTLNNQGQLINWHFDLNWQLAIKLPNTDENQVFPIASQQLKVQGTHAGSNSLFELCDLIDINGLTLFNFEDVSITVPSVDFTNGQNVYLHNSVDIDIDGSAGLDIPIITTTQPSSSSDPVFDAGLVQFYRTSPDINLPAFTIPIPTLSTEENSSDTVLFSIPEPGTEDISLGEIRLEDIQLNLKLAWRDGKLGILESVGQQFIAFDSLSNIIINIGIIGFGGLRGR